MTKTMETYYSFNSPLDFETFLRTKEWKSGELDYITVNGLVYTMHEYDNDGVYIQWANKKHKSMIELTNSNRYKNGYEDSTVEEYTTDYFRDDIHYEQ